MTVQPLPALTSGDPSAWDQALYAFLVEKGNRSGSRRTVESYSRMLWPFFADLGKTADRIKLADVLAWVHGIGKSGRTLSATTVGARIACLSAFEQSNRTRQQGRLSVHARSTCKQWRARQDSNTR